ncbi:siderophore-interacting protein [Methylovorus sp. MP688]|uniref:siderophore-interacting protein n=1 Tax=Methylovorus sp. (strain MP688) TaxID=887061 RepID=UPI0001EC4FEC|nr:siderophore-interacting protein [Methylovorus sp. MP688]ADQ85745.1 Siderophore-interacting protein [Methylovorus sp. MP688]
METLITERTFEKVRFPIEFREVVVSRVEKPTPGFVAVTFAGESLAGFNSLSFDDHIKFIFTNQHGERVRRDYTPRSFSAGDSTLTIEFAMHADGDAAYWAALAKPGDQATIAGPKGSMIIPKNLDWHVLIGDASSLPAIARRLEELPEDAHTIALIQIGQAEDRRQLKQPAGAIIKWPETPAMLNEMLEALAWPEGEGFVWAAGEHSSMLEVRSRLLALGLPKERMKVAAYWKKGARDFHEKI